MEKKLLCVLFFLTCFTFYKAQSPTFQWVKSAGGTSAVEGHALTVDNTGNVITSGYFYGTADFDPGPSTYTLSSTGPRRDIFVLKLDALGNFIWAKQFSGLDFEDAISIITDPQGDLYISGYFESTVDFDPGLSTFNLTSNGNNDIFICKLNNSGNFLWAKSFGDVNNDYGNSVTIDTKGYPLILGSFDGTVDFDPGPGTTIINAYGSNDVFINKLDPNGNFIWVKRIGGPGIDYAGKIKVDTSGNIYSCGYFSLAAIDLDPGIGTYTLNTAGSWDSYVLKLDSTGNFIWAKAFGGTNWDQCHDIDIDLSGNVYTSGTFFATADFDPGPSVYNLTSAGNYEIFVSKLDSIGNFIWAKQMGGANQDQSYSISLDSKRNVYTTGYFQSLVADFDPGPSTFTLTPGTSQGGHLSMLDYNGNFVWAALLGSIGFCVYTDPYDCIYLTGSFDGVRDFDPGPGSTTLTANTNDLYVHKMCQQISLSVDKRINESYLDIYPNPSQGFFYLTINSVSQLIVTNILGQELLNEKINSGKQIINLQDQSDGIYFVKVIQEGKQYINKIIKE